MPQRSARPSGCLRWRQTTFRSAALTAEPPTCERLLEELALGQPTAHLTPGDPPTQEITALSLKRGPLASADRRTRAWAEEAGKALPTSVQGSS